MTTEQMRQAILVKYPGEAWKQKVAKMSDAQVQAIYFRLSLKD